MLEHFNIDDFAAVVLDESSILKSLDGALRTKIISGFSKTKYRLACTATPSPNDFVELGSHSEFLGVATRSEMQSTFFINDGGDTGKWRLKGHAKNDFWKWVCGWGAMIRSPETLGYDGSDFALPELTWHDVVVPVRHRYAGGMLFQMDAQTLQERRAARRDTIDDRVAKCAEIVETDPDGPWLIWCGLNDEADRIQAAIPGSTQVTGSDPWEQKEAASLAFASGKIKVLISKARIFGFGSNFQVCHKMIYLGLSDSFEQLYQSVRRCYRFGQQHPVDAYVVTSSLEGAVVRNIRRKEEDAEKMRREMEANTIEYVRSINSSRTARQMIASEPMVELRVPEWINSEDA